MCHEMNTNEMAAVAKFAFDLRSGPSGLTRAKFISVTTTIDTVVVTRALLSCWMAATMDTILS